MHSAGDADSREKSQLRELLATIREVATPYFSLRNCQAYSPRATIAMGSIQEALSLLVRDISEENYDQSFTCYRLWSEITQTYSQIHPDQVFDSICNNRVSSAIDPGSGKFIHPTAHLIVRFASDAESDGILASQSIGLQSRLCARTLRDFFENNMVNVRSLVQECWDDFSYEFHSHVNFIAHWTNLGYVEEAAIRDHILQSLISHPILYHHQVSALTILFKLAGATFAKYADPAVVDRCFELLNDFRHRNPESAKNGLILVRVVPRNEMLPSG